MVLRVFDQLSAANANNVHTKNDPFSNLVGHFGKWQLIVFATVCLVKFSSGWVQMAILFLTPKTVYWCVDFGDNTTRIVENSSCYKDCVKYEYDSSPMGNTIISEWGLICERAWLASFTQTVLQLGILLGSIIFGFLSDRYGRKNTFLVSIVMLITLGFGLPFSPNYIVFTAIRFFIGVATAGTMVISFVIVMETIGTKYRVIFGCLFHIPFMIGHTMLPMFGYFFRDWDDYSLALAIPPVMYLMYFFVLSESPRWLVSVGRVEEASKIVKHAAKMNKLPTVQVEETLANLSKEILNNKTDEPKVNYLDLIKTANIRKITFAACFIWFTGGLTFFGVNQYISQTSPDIFVSVAAAGAIQIPSNFAAIWLINKFGRRTSASLFLCLDGLIILTLGSIPDNYWLNLALGTLGVSFASIVNVAIYIYFSELYPTVVRNMGMGICSTWMRVGSMIAPFVANVSPNLFWLPTAVFGLVPIVAGFICLLLPETKDNVLPDSIDDVEK